jgi:hypothetical protein
MLRMIDGLVLTTDAPEAEECEPRSAYFAEFSTLYCSEITGGAFNHAKPRTVHTAKNPEATGLTVPNSQLFQAVPAEPTPLWSAYQR